MAKLTLSRPSVGEKNTVAVPKVDTALALIETWANGEVGTENITPETITEGMLVKSVQEKLGGSIFGLAHKASAISASVANGELLEMTGASTTATLPAATKNRVVGVYAAAAGVKVKTAAGVITGDFITGQATIQLELGQHVVLEAEGTNWRIIAGEPKREQVYSGLVGHTKVEMEAGVEISASRPALASVQLEGAWSGTESVVVGGPKIAAVVAKAETGSSATSVTVYVPPGQKVASTKAAVISAILQ